MVAFVLTWFCLFCTGYDMQGRLLLAMQRVGIVSVWFQADLLRSIVEFVWISAGLPIRIIQTSASTTTCARCNDISSYNTDTYTCVPVITGLSFYPCAGY